MITEEVRVTWLDERKVTPPTDYINNPTKEDWDAYEKAKDNATVRKHGIVLDFVTNTFGGTKAIISSGDNKIVKVPIEKLTVIHKAKKK